MKNYRARQKTKEDKRLADLARATIPENQSLAVTVIETNGTSSPFALSTSIRKDIARYFDNMKAPAIVHAMDIWMDENKEMLNDLVGTQAAAEGIPAHETVGMRRRIITQQWKALCDDIKLEFEEKAAIENVNLEKEFYRIRTAEEIQQLRVINCVPFHL